MSIAGHDERRIDRAKTLGFEPKHESCATCRFWLPDFSTVSSAETDGEAGVELAYGVCRRSPPAIVQPVINRLMTPNHRDQATELHDLVDSTDLFDASHFPGTFSLEWCGEFQWLPKLQPSEAPVC